MIFIFIIQMYYQGVLKSQKAKENLKIYTSNCQQKTILLSTEKVYQKQLLQV